MDPAASSIRNLKTDAEFRDCVAFQRQIWGDTFADVVPAAILQIARRTGGIIAAAFDEEDRMEGFVFGLTGIDNDGPFHWSDMLGVRQDMRGRGLGRALKAFQRDDLLKRGISRSRWTFDPLEAANAHFNFNVLGATAAEYAADFYGVSDSPLHAGLPTDRLIVNWQMNSDHVRNRMAEPAKRTATTAPVINPDHSEPRLDLDAAELALSIPADIQTLKKRDLPKAVQWRLQVRSAMQAYFGKGYRAVQVAETGDGPCYLLRR